MAYDRFLIAPIKSGLITEIQAWQIPEDAYTRLNNAYIYHGVVRKRFGTQLMGSQNPLTSRLRMKLGTTDGNGDFGDGATTLAPGSRFDAGQMFSIGTEIFTVQTTGTPVTMLSTGSATVRTYNTTTGSYQFEDATPNTDVYFFPADPVMGLSHYEENKVESNTPYAFDRQFIYKYTSCAWERDDAGAVVLHGSDSQFVWSWNWTGVELDDIALFSTNFNATLGTPNVNDDPIYALKNGTWGEFLPVYAVDSNAPTGWVTSAKIVIPFKNRLLLLNTIELTYDPGGPTSTNKEHVNRCRFSRNGAPFPADGLANAEANVSRAWLEPDMEWVVGATTKRSVGADYLDAPTEEEIISAEFIKDRLIVYFEASTYELAWTGNKVVPFQWQKLNTELGTLSTKSAVPFDKAVLNVGRTGIHGCNGANVAKINEKVSHLAYDIRIANDGPERISGIRDYFIDTVYWSYPDTSANADSQIFPGKVIIYNYNEDAWGIADDTITAFGYYEEQTCLASQVKYRQVIAGNQQGYVFFCDSNVLTPAEVLQITALADAGGGVANLTIINHTLNDNDFITITGVEGATIDETVNYKVTVVNSDTISIVSAFTGTYSGGGRAARVPLIDILSKQWNFYIDKGKNCFLAKIDFAVKKTTSGEVTVDYYPSSTELSMITSGQTTGSILGNNNLETSPYALYPLEQEQTRLWHSVYFQTEGECVQIRIYLDDVQMAKQAIASSDLQIQGLVIYSRPTSERLQ